MTNLELFHMQVLFKGTRSKALLAKLGIKLSKNGHTEAKIGLTKSGQNWPKCGQKWPQNWPTTTNHYQPLYSEILSCCWLLLIAVDCYWWAKLKLSLTHWLTKWFREKLAHLKNYSSCSLDIQDFSLAQLWASAPMRRIDYSHRKESTIWAEQDCNQKYPGSI